MDDTIFFFKANCEELLSLKLILLVLGHISCIKINLEKNTVVGINEREDVIVDLASLMECRSLMVPYLGLPLRGNLRVDSF